MKSSKKMMIIGGVLLGVGVIAIAGVFKSENKLALIVGSLLFLASGVILLVIGILKNKTDSSTIVKTAVQSTAPPQAKLPVQNKLQNNVNGTRKVDWLPMASDGFVKVYQYDENLCCIKDQPSPLPYIQEKANNRIRQLTFEFEPDNPYDSNAVMVKLDGKVIGYVYKNQTQQMIHDWDKKGFEIVAHINTFSPDRITYKIGFYKPIEKCKKFVVPYKNAKFADNHSEGEFIKVEYDVVNEAFIYNDIMEDKEYKLPKKVSEYASQYYQTPAEIGENCESLIFYK